MVGARKEGGLSDCGFRTGKEIDDIQFKILVTYCSEGIKRHFTTPIITTSHTHKQPAYTIPCLPRICSFLPLQPSARERNPERNKRENIPTGNCSNFFPSLFPHLSNCRQPSCLIMIKLNSSILFPGTSNAIE